MKNKNVRNKILSVLLAVIMIFSSIYPIASVVAYAADYYGRAVMINGEISPSVDSSNNYSFSNSDVLTLEWMESGNGHDEGWWLGLKITAPESMSADELESAKFTVNSGEPESFWEKKSSADEAQEHYITDWIEITGSKLDSEDGIEVEYTFYWNSDDGTTTQTFKVSLDESKVVLTKNGFITYPETSKFAAVDSLDLTVSGSETEKVTVANDSVKSFTWKEANSEEGITEDGWWTSITVSAPAGITVAALADSTYKVTDGIATSFIDDADSDSDLILWVNFDEEEVEDNETVSSSWEFDWDNNGTFEQKVTVTLDCKNVILIKEDKQVYPLYTVTFTAGENGSIEITNPDSLIGEDEVTVQKDQVIRYKISADDGYVISSIKYNSQAIEFAEELETYNGKITVSADSEIDASFELKNYDIIYHTPIGIAPLNETYTIEDTEHELATPKSVDGYTFVGWAYADGNLVSYKNVIEYSTINGNEVRSDLELYAVWTVDAEINVKDAESDKWVNGDERTLTITSGIADGIYTYSYGENSATTDGTVTISQSDEASTVTYDVTYVTFKDDGINYLYSVNADEYTLKRDGYSPALKVTYTTKVSQLILKTLSFGFYKPNVLVKVEAIEEGSGVDYFIINAVADGSELATEKELPENLKIYTSKSSEDYNSDDSAITIEKITETSLEFTISSNLRAIFDYTVADKVGNTSEGKGSEFNGENDIIITDNISPKISVEYTWSGDVSPTLADKDNKNVTTVEEAAKIYHNGDINLKFTVNDANFFEGEELADSADRYAHAINILVHKTVDGETITEEFLPNKDAEKSDANANASVLEWTEIEDSVYVAEITLKDEGEYLIEVSYSDFSGNDAVVADENNVGVTEYKSKDLIIDKTAPVIKSATYKCDTDILPGDIYYSDKVTAEITLEEKNFRASEISAEITAKDINGNEITDTSIINYIQSILIDDDTWVASGDKKEYTAKFELPGDANYTFDISYTDLANNDAADYVADELAVDTTAPIDTTVTYEGFTESIILKALSFGFYKDEVKVTLSAKDVTTGIKRFEFTIEANEDYPLATDILIPEKIIVDSDSKVYVVSTEGAEAVEVTADNADVLLKDISVPKFIIDAEDASVAQVEFTMPEEFSGRVKFVAANRAEHVYDHDIDADGIDEYENDKNVVIDSISPEVTVEYIPVDDSRLVQEIAGEEYSNIYYNGAVKAKVTIDEANFFEGKINEDDTVIHNVKIILSKTDNNGNIVKREFKPTDSAMLSEFEYFTDFDWTPTDVGKYEMEIDLTEDADYQLSLEYTDYSKNDANITEGDKKSFEKIYTSDFVTVDTTAPVINAAVYSNGEAVQTVDGRDYYNSIQTAKIVVEEHNFRASDVVAAVTAKDVKGSDVSNELVNDLISQAKDEKRWKSEGNIHTLELNFDAEANYTFDISMTDLAKNESADYEDDIFTVDTVDPENLAIEYQESIIDILLEGITLGFYNPDATVILKAEDITSGIEYFTIDVETDGSKAATTVELPEKLVVDKDGIVSGENGFINEDIKLTVSEEKAEVSFVVPAEYRGKIKFTATDLSHNTNDQFKEIKDEKVIEQYIVVSDKNNPDVTIEYKPVAEDTLVQFVDSTTLKNCEEQKIVDENTQVYYNGPINATIKVTEENFFEGKFDELTKKYINDVVIILEKTDENGVVEKIQYVPDGVPAMDNTITSTKTVEWEQNGDEYTFTINYDTDADYVLYVDYADKSTNTAEVTATDKTATKIYRSNVFTVDTKAPVINIVYDKTVDDAVNVFDGRSYFDVYRQATITVNEHNFRTSDFVINLIAKDYAGDDVAVSLVDSIKTQIASIENWTKNHNTYTTTINYKQDANYDFDIEYKDLAQNSIADYANDVFTIDQRNPYAVQVTYKERIIDKIIKGITFGYYNTNVEVTVTAYDSTSGVLSFDYEGILAENVSEINKKIAKSAIENAEVTHIEGTKKSVASFTIPKKALNSKNSFNGTVTIAAYDRTNHSAVVIDEERLIVDNIKPTGQLKFSNPVDLVDNVTYYDGPITAMISINEANFYAQDVEVYIDEDMTKRISIPESAWEKNGDVFSTSFEISEEGEYNVVVKYSDRSGNEMETIVSDKLIVDTTVPRIEIHNIGQRSANNDEIIGFIISVIDKNIGAEEIVPTCFATVRVDTGDFSEYKFTQNAIRLGNASHSINSSGESVYTYTVNNLETDGYYSLRCSASDYAGHTISNMSITDSKVSSDTLNFSVNRLGSTFWISSTYTTKDSDKTYTDSINGKYINGDVKIELHEINVDEVNHDASSDKQTVFTLNDGSTASDIILEEGKNYVKNTNAAQNSGGWFESIYTLDEENFDHDGNYSISILTYDRASNSNLNTKATEGTVEFTVDRTTPVISSNIESNARIKDSEYTVEFKVNEANLSTDKKDIVVTYEGNEVEYESIGNNEYKFTIRQGTKQEIRIKVTDLANNVSEEYVVENITISTNALVLFFANTQLVLTVVAGIVLAIAIIFILLFLKKRKRNEDE